jgi:aryl-alcohol dehydrogenase-like predicted oxidoreductase
MLRSADQTSVYPISLGGAGIGSCEGSVFFKEPVLETQAVDTVLFALENGINLIDTSPFYGNSEKKIGLAVKEYGRRASFMLSTKVGTHPLYKGFSADNIRRSIGNSLKLLQTDYLDIVHIHDPTENDFNALMERSEGMDVLLKLKSENIIRAIGLGVRDHEMHSRFIASGFADIILPYMDYNLLRTTASKLLTEAQKRNIPVMLGSALCMGLLSGRDPLSIMVSHYDIAKEVSIEKAVKMYKWALSHKVNLMALNYKFISDHPAVSTIIAGASSKQEVEESLKAYRESVDPLIMKSFLEEFEIQKNYKQA